jgi:drug/metabolite transporter (DMT)-like permease
MTDFTRTLAAFLATSLLFGGTFVAAKAGLAEIPPLLFVALRFDIAAVALIAYVLIRRERAALIPRSRSDLAGILAAGVFAIGLTNALLFIGQQAETSAVASIVYSLNPIFTPVLAAGLLAEDRLSRRGAAGLVLGLVGVGLVVAPDPAALLAGGPAKLYLLGGALAGALGTVLIRAADDGLDSSVRTAWGLPVGALICHAASAGAGESLASVTWTATAIVALAYVGLLAGAVAYITYFWLLDDVGPIHANLVFYVVPVVATLGGWALLGETIEPTALAGFLTIFAGFAVLASESVSLDAIRGHTVWPGSRSRPTNSYADGTRVDAD